MRNEVPTVKKGIHAGEEILPVPHEQWADHSFGLEKQRASKRRLHEGFERRRKSKENEESKVVGTKPHRRRWQHDWDLDQEKAASTCVVELYPKGMGLRVERRKEGYSLTGGSSGFVIEGEGDDRTVHREGAGNGGKRGRCKGATASAMARFRDKVYKVDRNAIPVFITLGWPKGNTPTPEEAKECLNHFLITLVRKYPRACGFWKLEFGEKAGLPHYHIILWGAKPWKGWLSKTWYRICGTCNPAHLAAGTKIERLRSYRGTLSYCGKKYMAKQGLTPPGHWGRSWGCFNRTKIPWDTPMVIEAPWRTGMWFARIQRRFMRAKYGRKNGGRGRVMWVNPDHAAQWLRVLEWADDLPCPSGGRTCATR